MRYFQWSNAFEKNNCVLAGLDFDVASELHRGKSLAKKRKKPYVYPMDPEYKKNIRLTDSLMNDMHTIVASPRLRDLLVDRLGKAIEVLEVHVQDHKGRIASKDYSIINLLDLKACVDLDRSTTFWGNLDGKRTVLDVEDMVLDPKKIGKDSLLFRANPPTRTIVAREDLVKELKAAKVEGVSFSPLASV
jgi:hypothetical protein